MAIELEKLLFSVDTGQLKDALDKIDAISSSVSKLASATDKLNKTTEDEVKTKKKKTKATEEAVSAEEKLSKAEEETTSKLSAKEKLLQKTSDKVQLLRNQTIEVANSTFKFDSALTTSQASLAAQLKIIGGGIDDFKLLNVQLKNLNSFANTNPFDKAVDGVQSLKRQIRDLNLLDEFKGLGLASEQIKALSRDIEKIKQTGAAANLPQAQISAEIERVKKETIALANEVNTRNAQAKEIERIAKEKAKAEAAALAARQSYKNAEEAVSKEILGSMKQYYQQMESADREAENARRDSFSRMVQIHEWKQQQDEQNYRQDMQNMRKYYQAMEREASSAMQIIKQEQDALSKEQLHGKYMQAGYSSRTAGVAAGLEMKGVPQDVINSYLQEAKANEEASRAYRDKLTAIRAVQSAEERATHALDSLNMETAEGAQMNERAALAVAAYERNLRLAGVSAEQAAKKSALFRQQQAEIAKASSRNQMDYLARGVGVQLGDVGVSLASGMNPLTVAIQQGDQLRGLIQQVGANTKDMEKVMATAVSQIASSFALLGTAVSSFVKGAIVSLGEFIVTSAKIDKAMQYAVENAVLSKEAAEKLGKTLSAVSGIAMTGFIGAIGAVTLAMFQMLEANKQLDQELAKRGALLGLTSTEIRGMAKELAGTKTTLATTTEAFAAFASSSITNSEMLNKAVSEAIKNNRSLGLSYEEQAKIYDKLSDKPVKALIDLNKEMGLTDAASIRRINKLWEEGKAQEAVVLAQEKYMQGMENVRKIADANKTEIAKLWTEIKDAAIAAWTEVQKIGDDTFWKGVRTLFAAMRTALANIFSVLKGVVVAAWNLMQGKIDAAMNSWQGIDAEVIQNQEEYTNKLKEIWTIDKASGEDAKRLALERQKNAKDSIGLEEKLRKEKEEAGKIQNAYNSYMKTFGDILAEATGKQELLTKAEVKMMEVLQSEYWAKLTPEMKKNVLMKYDLARASELVANALKAESEAIKSWSKVQKDLQNQNVELDKRNQVIKNELNLLGLVGVEREKATREMELQNKYAAAQARYEKTKLDIIQEYTDAQSKAAKEVLDPNSRQKIYKDNADQYEAAMKQAEELLNKERVISRKEVDKSIAESYYKEMQRVSDMLADVLITALTEGGKAGSKKLGDYIKKELLSASSMFISSIIRAQLGNVMQSAFGINAANYAGGTLAGNLVGTPPGSLLSSAITGVGNLAGSTGLASFGAGMGLSSAEAAAASAAYSSAGMGTVASSLQAGSMLGAAMPWISGGLMVASLLGGDLFGSGGAPKSMTGGGGRITNGVASFDPTGLQHWTDYTSADKAFGSSILSEQLLGILKSIDPSYSAGAFIKGEINTKGSSSNQGLAQASGKTGNIIYHYFKEAGKGVEDFQKFVAEELPKVQLALVVDAMRGKSEDYKKIVNSLVGDSDNLTDTLKEMSSEGVQQLQANLSSALGVFEQAKVIFSNITGETVAILAKASGGFDAVRANLSSFYENYFSDEEKALDLRKNIQEQLKTAGVEMPSSLVQFKKLVQSLDLSSESGQKAFVALMQVQNGFKELIETESQAADATANFVDSIKDYLKALETIPEISTVSSSYSALKASVSSTASKAFTDESARGSLTSIADQFLEVAKKKAPNAIEYAKDVAFINSVLQGVVNLGNSSIIPAFDAGGSYGGGVALVGESGPELINFNRPGQIYNAGQSSMILGENASNVISIMEAVNENITLLRAEVRADVQHNAKTAKILERVTPDKNSLSVTTT